MLLFKKTKLVVTLAAGLTLFQSCKKVVGHGDVVTETKIVADFNELELNAPGELQFTEGSTFSVQFEGEQNILDELEAVVIGTTLKIKERKVGVNLRPRQPLIFRVTAPAIHKMELSGSGNITANAAINTTELALNISGSGNIKLAAVNTPFINALTKGSGNITVSGGIVQNQSLKVNGSGNIDNVAVAGVTATVNISGSGNVKVFAAQLLEIKISGSGNVYYKGNPAVTTDIHGSGNIVHL